MKIGIFLADIPPEHGGVHTFQLEVVRAALAAPGAHQFVLVLRAAEWPAWQPLLGDHKWVDIGLPPEQRGRAHVGELLRRLPPLQSAVDEWNAEQARLHHNAVLTRAGIDAVWFPTPRYARVDHPYVYTILDVQHRRQPWFPEVGNWPEWSQRERFYREALARAFAVLVQNSVGADEVARYYGVDRERLVEVDHPTPTFSAADIAASESAGAPAGLPACFLLYPARFWPHKNHLVLLHALVALRDERGLKLDLVLTGSDHGNVNHVRSEATRLQVADQVHVLSFVERSQLIYLYRHALALVYPSLFGPENLPPLEAFALDCPVVAGAVAGAAEQLGDGAMLVDPLDARQFADAIARLHGEPELRRQLIERGRARANRFTGRAYVDRVMATFDRLALARRNWPAGSTYPRPA